MNMKMDILYLSCGCVVCQPEGHGYSIALNGSCLRCGDSTGAVAMETREVRSI